MFKVVTLNVRGLNPPKLDLISDVFTRERLDFICIQETMVSDPNSQEALAKRWKGPSFWAPASGRRGGVAILCSPRQSDNVSVWQKDTGGRLLSILISLQNLKINLVNIYAPTNPTERKNFFQSISSFVFPNSRLIIAGDFNSYDSALDKMGGSVSIDAHFSELK